MGMQKTLLDNFGSVIGVFEMLSGFVGGAFRSRCRCEASQRTVLMRVASAKRPPFWWGRFSG